MFEEALQRAGGFGAYQVFMLIMSSALCNYGSVFVFAYGYLTNAPRYLCREVDAASKSWADWEVCSREYIC